MPMAYADVFINRIYFFKASFKGAYNIILNYTNFIAITNTSETKKIVLIKIYLSYFSDYTSEEAYFTLVENAAYFTLVIITPKVNENDKENISPIKKL